MTLNNDEFIRRFLLHTLPSGFHRIRHCGLIANTGCKKNLVKARKLLSVPEPVSEAEELIEDKFITQEPVFVCPECGGPMVIKEILISKLKPRAPPMRLVN